MQDDPAHLDEEEFAARLHEIVDEMLASFGKRSPRGQPNVLNPNPLPIVVTKENEHDTKAEFTAELEAVEKSAADLRAVLMRLRGGSDTALDGKVRDGLLNAINQHMRRNAPVASPQDSIGLIRRNVAEVNGFFCSFLVLFDLMSALDARLERLREQETLFWSLKNRAPDYYARAIALRLARLYANQTGQRPTVGTAPDSGDPSTNYTRALQKVFNLLSISTGVRSPAAWAVEQIVDEDLREPINYLAMMRPLPNAATGQSGLLSEILSFSGGEKD